MLLTFKVDQTKAFKMGIDAPNSTAKVDVNPSELNQQQREYIATRVRDGHDCTAISIVQANMAGVIEEVNRGLAVERQNEIRAIERADKCAMERIKEMNSGKTESVTVHLGIDGKIQSWSGSVKKLSVEVPYIPAGSADDCSDDVKSQHNELRDHLLAERNGLIEAAVEAAQDEISEMRREREAVVQRDTQLIVDAITKIPESVQRRHEAGYMPDQEWRDLITANLQAGLAESVRRIAGKHRPIEMIDQDGRSVQAQPDDIEQDGFDLLYPMMGFIPGSEIVKLYHGGNYRAATEDDDPNKIDSDGEVYVAKHDIEYALRLHRDIRDYKVDVFFRPAKK